MPEVPALTLGVGDFTLELVNHAVHRDRRKIELSARELILLKVLTREPGRVFTRTELCERVWEHAHEYDTNWWKFSSDAYDKNSGKPSTDSHCAPRRLHDLRIKRPFR